MTSRIEVEALAARVAELEAELAAHEQLADSAAVAGDEQLNGNGLAAVAQLEAQRVLGRRLLLVPEARRSWLTEDPVLSAHVREHYAVISDRPESGLLLDLGGRRPRPTPRTLSEVLAKLIGRDPQAPVLDWSDLGLAALAPGHNVFCASGEEAELPYLDATIDVVVIDDARRLDEARRVAARAALLLEADDDEVSVRDVHLVATDAAIATGRVLVQVDGNPDEAWQRRIVEALGDEHDVQFVAAGSRPRRRRDDLFLRLDAGVLPLPGAVAIARATLASTAADGVAVKLLAADGSLEAAGAMVLDDGEVAGIARGAELDAAWHEFVRPVGAALGMCVSRTQRPRSIVYQPEASAVRALGATSSVRPSAPEPAWRALIAQGATV